MNAIIAHEVKDFDSWKPLFDGHESARAGAGIRVLHLFRGVENPNMVTILTEAPDRESYDRFFASPGLKDAMEKGGVLGRPDFTLLQPVAAVVAQP